MLILYGLGTTIGAGIYALMGEIAGVARYGAPFSFLVASIIAAFTACSFAELSARYPRAAGAALYVQSAFAHRQVALIVGLLVVVAGIVSSAALVNGFTGYLQHFLAVDRTLTIVAVCTLLGVVAAWGITESVALVIAITFVEVGGLVFVIGLGADGFADLSERWQEFMPGRDTAPWGGLFVGVTLAFYAYIGFEDIVDVAEEVTNVQTTMPGAILVTLAVSTLLYILLMVSALLTMTPEALAASDAPVAALYEVHTGRNPMLMGAVATIAIINGALIQVVMASRVLYGLSMRGQLPVLLGHIDPRTRTPLVATVLVTVVLMVLALSGRLAILAATTSVIMLIIFGVVNLALWRIKARVPVADDVVSFPRWMPMVGAVLCAGFALREVVGRLGH